MSGSNDINAPAATAADAITSRKSIRRFLPDPVSRETVERLLAVASRAPSGTNIQPWKVYVVAGEAKAALSAAILEAHDAGAKNEREYNDYPLEFTEPYLGRRRKIGWDLYGLLGIERGDKDKMHAQHGRNFLFFDAPVGLFFSLDRDLELGSWVDMGMFIENVMIAARGQGLDTCPQAAWVGYHKAIREPLGIPEHEALVCGMCLGHEDTRAPANALETEREPVDGFAKFFGF